MTNFYFTDPDWWDSVDSSNLRIGLLGVEKEVEMLPLFKVHVHTVNAVFSSP